jgi:hypothetical protein
MLHERSVDVCKNPIRTKSIMKTLLLLVALLVACIQDKPKDFQLIALPPITYEFKTGENRNRIAYFYVEGNFSYDHIAYEKLKRKVEEKIAGAPTGNYHLYSVYLYKKNDLLNKDYSGGKAGLDGHNQNLLAYVRYSQGKMDIFYIIEKEKVVYDLLSDKEENFEFEQ